MAQGAVAYGDLALERDCQQGGKTHGEQSKGTKENLVANGYNNTLSELEFNEVAATVYQLGAVNNSDDLDGLCFFCKLPSESLLKEERLLVTRLDIRGQGADVNGLGGL
ncbi:hypothetical protein ACP70R_027083 [Stipagrostis hirtigluma subsp. patula]